MSDRLSRLAPTLFAVLAALLQMFIKDFQQKIQFIVFAFITTFIALAFDSLVEVKKKGGE